MTYILYNPLANGGNGYEGLGEVQAAFPEAELRDITQISTAPFLTLLTITDRFILCGGLGSTSHFVNALPDPASLEPPIYIWKFGTANDSWPAAPEKGELEMVLLNDYMKNLPYAEVNGKRIRFVNDCGLGVDSRVCEMGEEHKKKTGKRMNYIILALKAILFDYKRATARVTIDGVTREYSKVWLATAMNGRYIGGGMKLTPDQDRRSDELCCIVWHKTSRPLTIPLFISVFSGSHVKLKSMFDIHFGKDIRVEFDRPCALNLDGEVHSGILSYSAHK